jgi:D-2-hydroxyacid dehydrogenase (NADP+)
LPKVTGVTDDFFNMDSTFKKMKKTAVFMNIGRGTTVNENDLVEALKGGNIGGAVLDVYKVEPLPKESALWGCENLLMFPHCADNDRTFLHRAFAILGENLKNWCEKGPGQIVNVCDKNLGY